TTLILRPGSPTCWRGSPIIPRTKSRICFRGIGKRHASRSRPDPRLSRQTRSARGAHRMHTYRIGNIALKSLGIYVALGEGINPVAEEAKHRSRFEMSTGSESHTIDILR